RGREPGAARGDRAAYRPSAACAAAAPLHRQRRDDRSRGVLRASPPRHGDSGRRAQRPQAGIGMVMTQTLRDALAATRVAATAPQPGNSRDLVLGILRAAAEDPEVQAALRDVPAGRALLRFTDTHEAIEVSAGGGRLAA